MCIIINGKPRTFDTAPTVQALVDEVVGHSKGVAVAVNGKVVPASRWGSSLTDADTVDILTAVQGG
ncbi:sulfur carrier protein ThiS [Corynebacterium sp. HMSC071B10]|uniref:sulfur carrier protein ThiS n=1 Tax=Corynebacterium sp. HMSC071B10 TaxID=1739494 RepID=UPI0008A5EAB8|nr:sulfur carrier protein ThiS [Corynebacterium sp. HMSC071B10]OFP34022.1 thiamine biosynthesis protein ThiS [Corynebacterium sp. HMSC071B10]